MQKCRRGRALLAPATIRIEDAPYLQDRRFEVQKQAYPQIGRSKVRTNLGIVDSGQLLDRLEFHDNLVLDKQVQPVLPNRSSLERHTDPHFPTEPH
jgi:hypothetical protein